MRDIYFATYKLGRSDEPSPTIESVVPALEEWLFDPRHKLRKPSEYDPLASHHEFGADGNPDEEASFATRFHSEEEKHAYALRYQHLDTQIEGKRWVTEIVLSQKGEGVAQTTRASVNLRIGYEGAALKQDVNAVSRPRLVKTLIEEFGAYEFLPLSLEPRRLDVEEAETFVRLLSHPERVFPVVWISAQSNSEKLVLEPGPVADWLAGVAHVIVSSGSDPSWKMNDLLGERMNCYNGAIRIYWPGFSKKDSPYDHNLWTPQEVRQMEKRKRHGFKSHLLALIADAATNRLLDDVVRWADVRRLQSLYEIRERSADGENEKLLEAADSIIEDLEAEKRALKEERNKAKAKADRALNMSKSWRLAYDQERQLRAKDGKVTELAGPPATMSEAVEQAMDEYGIESDRNSLRIPKSTKNSITDEFEDPGSAFDALEWIATTFVDSKTGRESCTNLDLSCREASGFWYQPHQSKSTMGKYPADYFIEWNGEKRALRRHLGSGSGKDPRQTLRIAFFYDEDQKYVVVGFIGQHQTTDST